MSGDVARGPRLRVPAGGRSVRCTPPPCCTETPRTPEVPVAPGGFSQVCATLLSPPSEASLETVGTRPSLKAGACNSGFKSLRSLQTQTRINHFPDSYGGNLPKGHTPRTRPQTRIVLDDFFPGHWRNRFCPKDLCGPKKGMGGLKTVFSREF